MRPRAHELAAQLRSVFCESLRECDTGGEAATRLQSRGVVDMLRELAAENDASLTNLEQTATPKVAILNRPELIHFGAIVKLPELAMQQLVRAVASPLAKSHFPLSGIWRSYAAALVNLHRGERAQIDVPKAKGYEKYYLPYVQLMVAADEMQIGTARAAIAESFSTRNRDRRFTDWFGLDGDGQSPVRWDFRLYAIEAGQTMLST